MIAVDTNVLLRYLTKDDARQSPRAALLFAGEEPVLITDVVLAEALWTLKGKKYRLTPDDLARTVHALLEEPLVRFQDARSVWQALSDFRGGESGATVGADFSDALILNVARNAAAAMGEPFSGLYTFDVKARRMPGTASP